MKFTCWIAGGLLALGSAAGATTPEPLVPFVAEYQVRYGSMPVGSSRTVLVRGDAPGEWVIESQSNASGFARIIASGTLVHRSTFLLEGQRVRPLRYRFDDGMERSRRDVRLDFDWPAGRVTGREEGSPVDVPLEPGLQDAASIQAAVLVRLRGGAEPGEIALIEKDRIKRYRYTLLRRERLDTALGELDTVVYRSAREGTDRETLLWYAPSLGWLNVQAEQRRGGRRTFHTTITAYRPGG